ncbi:MAG: nucleotide sugar dehydrogenase [Candidatus Omnitrophica bacterium]|nr:nucleotide sugar dehydrogenase [Candidatus Omnitrophota bacterium]MBD3269258.1 nucleotide sugar dehydrogenase [Candidatus Omnitrophota bacterium]
MAKSEKKATGKRYKICVVGAGHVGLVASACFAELGHKVVCVDNNKQKINRINKGRMPFYEPGIDELVKKNIGKNLNFSSSFAGSIARSEVIFIAVGTPPKSDGSADLSSIENVAATIARNINSYKLIVGKSTVPVQTGQKIKETIKRYEKKKVTFDVASNPEFLREGKAIYDFFYPDRIVIGIESKRAEKILKEIYRKIKAPLIVTDINTAELIKHASNSFLATKISFINAVARICDLAGADVKKVSLAMGKDKRIGKEFLDAGVGYGGFCFPKDVEAFIYISQKLGYSFDLLRQVKKINDIQKATFVERVKEYLWILKRKRIAILGLSFKPDTDDMRFAPSIDIINFFLKEGAMLNLCDPQSNLEAKKIFKTGRQVKYFRNPYRACEGCDCICLVTEWKEFKDLDLKKIKRSMKYPLIADGRNMFDKDKAIKLGFEYIGVGR